jgi:hypothetical protein
VNVMAAARSIGLAVDDRGEVSGTIDENIVLATIATLAAADPDNEDVYADAVRRVHLARSAGVEQLDANSVLNRSRSAATVQLRARGEMAELFTDLAIDIGMRHARRLTSAPA